MSKKPNTQERKHMSLGKARTIINDICSEKTKRKKVCKKKHFKKLVEALKVVSMELETAERLNEMYKKQNESIIMENTTLKDNIISLERKYANLKQDNENLEEQLFQSDTNPEMYQTKVDLPEETKEEITIFEGLSEDDSEETEPIFK